MQASPTSAGPGTLPAENYSFPPSLPPPALPEFQRFESIPASRTRSNSLGSNDRTDTSSSPDRVGQATFLTKLWRYLVENPTNPSIQWSTDGKYLLIMDEERLVSDVILRLFKQKDYSSFSRQLNIYRFKRIQHSKEQRRSDFDTTKVWQHEFLTRDSPYEDLSLVRRNATNKRNRPRKGKNAVTAKRPTPLSMEAAPSLFHAAMSPTWSALSGRPALPASLPHAPAPIDITAPRMSSSAPAWLLGSAPGDFSIPSEAAFGHNFVFGSYTTTTTGFSFPATSSVWQPATTFGSPLFASPGSPLLFGDFRLPERRDLAGSPLRDVFAFRQPSDFLDLNSPKATITTVD